MGTDQSPAIIPLEPGRRLGDRFVLVRELGSGAVGAVWLGRDLVLDCEEVACKFLQQDLANDPDSVIDMKRELLLARKLRHPGIVALHTFWAVEGHRFITMEYIDGPDLGRMLDERGSAFEIDDVLPWAEQISDALEFAHGRGVLHRDIKPSNILLDPEGEIRIADFGIACTAQEARARYTGRTTSGTLYFMSPEQLAGDSLDRRSDLYSFAATVYELLNGAPPFHEGSVVAQIQFTPASPIASQSGAVNKVLIKALSKKRADRYHGCREFVEALAQAAGKGGQQSTPATIPTSRRSSPDSKTELMPRAIVERQRLGTILVEARAITEAQLNKALEDQKVEGGRIGELLIAYGAVTETTIADALERQLQIIREVPVRGDIDREIVAQVTPEWIVSHGCLPLRVEDDRLIVAMADPLDFDTVNELESLYALPVEPRIATASEITRVRGMMNL